MVLVSMTVLAIMGTLFTTIAMRSYEYSYAKLCKQQAYYTATSSVENFYTLITSKPTLFGKLLDSLNSEIVKEQGKNSKIDITTVRVMVGSSGGGTATTDADGNVTSVNLATAGFFATYLGDCDLYVRYANAERTELSIEAHATYNGYTETSRAIIARTNKAAEELKKIFDNVFCLQSPITTIVTERAYGDIYVSQPALPYFLNEGKMIDDLSTSEGAYNEVYMALEEYGSYGGYPETIPGQYVRNKSGGIVTDGVAGMYNAVLCDRVYGKAQASTLESQLTGHTKPIDIDGTPLPSRWYIDIDGTPLRNGWYNDWAEIYLFSADAGGTVVDGNLYADSRVLIGLLDRNNDNRLYMQVWNDVTKRFDLVYSESSWMYNQSPVFQGSAFGNSRTSGNFEHGFGQSVFFDHQGNDVLNRDISKFRINGNMYLWEDARIENFDSTNTQNALEGIKNNIYAAQDLYIAGIWNTHWIDMKGSIWDGKYARDRLQTEREVSIYGDVVVQGNAYIEGATIYGDVYVYGNELRMNDVTVYGNVYFDGQKFTGDRLTVTSGTLHEHACNGGNLIVAGNGKNTNYTSMPSVVTSGTSSETTSNATFGTSFDTGNSGVGSDWGAVLMDCDISGTLWSNVNTHVVVSKSERGLVCNNGAWESNAADFYGNIYCSRYLFIDLVWARDVGTWGSADRFPYQANWNKDVDDWYRFAVRNNSITVKGEVFAEKLQIRTNQKKWEVGDPPGYLDTDISYFGAVYVGGNGLYIDGNDSRNNGSWPEGSGMSGSFPDREKNIYINSLNHSGSKPDTIWDVCYGSEDEHNSAAVATKRSDIFDVSDSGAVIPDNLLLQSFGANENPLTYNDAVFGSANDDIWENKLITIRSWSAPAHSAKEADLEGGKAICYVGGTNDANAGITVANYIDPQTNPHYSNALSVSGTTLTIKESVWFKGDAEGKIDLSAFDKIVIDTSRGNIHIRFDGDVVIGKDDAASYHGTANDELVDGTNVVLTGGNMTFWYLYEEGGYDMNNPTLKLNPYTQIGLVQASGNVGRAYDGLYIVSNDDALIYLGKDASLNAFTYAPHGQLFMEPGSKGGANTMNGCMAIESLILISDADADDSSGWDDFVDWVHGLTGGKVGDDIEDTVVGQYKESNYHYVQPPLIVDFGFTYGDIESEIKDYGQVIWAFLGYY